MTACIIPSAVTRLPDLWGAPIQLMKYIVQKARSWQASEQQFDGASVLTCTTSTVAAQVQHARSDSSCELRGNVVSEPNSTFKFFASTWSLSLLKKCLWTMRQFCRGATPELNADCSQTNSRTTVPTHRSTLLYTLNFRCSHNQALKHARAHTHTCSPSMLSIGCAMFEC